MSVALDLWKKGITSDYAPTDIAGCAPIESYAVVGALGGARYGS